MYNSWIEIYKFLIKKTIIFSISYAQWMKMSYSFPALFNFLQEWDGLKNYDNTDEDNDDSQHGGHNYGNTGCGVFIRGYKIRKVFG